MIFICSSAEANLGGIIFLKKFIQEFTNFSGLNLPSDGLQKGETNINFLHFNLKFLNRKCVTSEYVKNLKPLTYINYKAKQPKQLMKSIINGESTRVYGLCNSIGITCINSDDPQKNVVKSFKTSQTMETRF